MRKSLCILCTILFSFGILDVAHATLYDQGGGLIYDDVLGITWLQNANLAATETFGVSGIDSNGRMSWYTANEWIDAMNSSNYLGYSDWRLPDSHNQDGSGPDDGYNVTGSEMGYMFYENLGNLGYYDTDGNYVGDGNWGLNNTSFNSGGPSGPEVSFQNLYPVAYWSCTESDSFPEDAWHFFFEIGTQDTDNKGIDNFYYVWAVRPGESAPVPEPATMPWIPLLLLDD